MPGHLGFEPIPPRDKDEPTSLSEHLPYVDAASGGSLDADRKGKLLAAGFLVLILLPLAGFPGIVAATFLTPLLLLFVIFQFKSQDEAMAEHTFSQVALPFCEEQFLVQIHQDVFGQALISDSGFVTIVDDQLLFVGNRCNLRFERTLVDLNPNGASILTTNAGGTEIDTYFTPFGWIPAGETEVQVTYAELYNRLHAWKFGDDVSPRTLA